MRLAVWRSFLTQSYYTVLLADENGDAVKLVGYNTEHEAKAAVTAARMALMEGSGIDLDVSWE